LVGLVGGLVGLVGGLLGGLAGGARSNVGGLLGGLLSLGGLDSARGVGGAISGSAPSMAERRAPRSGGPSDGAVRLEGPIPTALETKTTLVRGRKPGDPFSTLDAKTSLLSEKGGLGERAEDGGGIGGTAGV
jgi:hypothetical protein